MTEPALHQPTTDTAEKRKLTSIEFRAPADERQPDGEYWMLPANGEKPCKGRRDGRMHPTEQPGTIAVWLCPRANYREQYAPGVLSSSKAFANIPSRYWLGEWGAFPRPWNAEKLLLQSAALVRQVLAWIERWDSDAEVADGRIRLNMPEMSPLHFPPPPGSMDIGGQVSCWLGNGDGGAVHMGPVRRAYIRRDAVVRHLAGCDWPVGPWQRVGAQAATAVLKEGDAEWVGLIEAQPPRLGILCGKDARGRRRRLWSAAEILAWGLEGWDIRSAWMPEDTDERPFGGLDEVFADMCGTAPMCNLAALHRFYSATIEQRGVASHFSPTQSWLSSRSRALVAPAAKAAYRLLGRTASSGRVYGQHLGALYLAAACDKEAERLAATMRKAQPLMMAPAPVWRQIEAARPELNRQGNRVRRGIQAMLDMGRPLPQAFSTDLLRYGTPAQLLAADSLVFAQSKTNARS